MLRYNEIFSVYTLAVCVSSYECTWEVWRELKQLLRFSRALKTYILRASLTWYTHVKHVAILYCTSPAPSPPQIHLWISAPLDFTLIKE